MSMEAMIVCIGKTKEGKCYEVQFGKNTSTDYRGKWFDGPFARTQAIKWAISFGLRVVNP